MRRKTTDDVAARVRLLMNGRGLSQKELAETLNVSEGYLSRILSGGRVWTVNLVLRVSGVLRVEPTALDPGISNYLRADLAGTDFTGQQLRVVYAVCKWLPRIDAESDLSALATVIEAFGRRS